MIQYLMEDVRETERLRKKSRPALFERQYLNEHLERRISANKKTVRLLDVGCGNGSIASYVAGRYHQIEVHAFDMKLERFHQEKEKHVSFGNLKFHAGNALSMAFNDNTFDLTFSRFLLEYVKDTEAVVKEMVRVTRSGGTVILQDLDGQLITHYPVDTKFLNKFTVIMNFLEESGFDPFVGRKLFYLARKCRLRQISVKLEPYHLIAGRIDRQNYDLWETKLEIAMPHLVKALGSKTEAIQFKTEYLNYLSNEDTLTFSNLFTVCGIK